MTLQINLDVEGTKQVLEQLEQIDSRLRTAAIARMRKALQPMVKGAQGFVPDKPPLSGMARGYVQWDSSLVRSSITSKVVERGRKGRYFRLGVLRMSSSAGGLFDMSGKNQANTEAGLRLVTNLTSRFGPPSRVMWRAYGTYQTLTEQALREAVADMEATLNGDMRL